MKIHAMAAVAAFLFVADALSAPLPERACFPVTGPARGTLKPGQTVTVSVPTGTCKSGQMNITGGKLNFRTNATIAPRHCECVGGRYELAVTR
jgi:hypothetical protein